MNKIKNWITILVVLIYSPCYSQWTKAIHINDQITVRCLEIPEYFGVYNIKYSDEIWFYGSKGDSYRILPNGDIYGKQKVDWRAVDPAIYDYRFTIVKQPSGPISYIIKRELDGEITDYAEIDVDLLSQNGNTIAALSKDSLFCLDTNLNVLSAEKFSHPEKQGDVFLTNWNGNIIPNEIGGFTFTLFALNLNKYQELCFNYPVVVKTDSTCQIEELKPSKPVMVEKKYKRKSMKVYPNPTTGIINVQNPDNELINILGLYGQHIMTVRGRRVDISDLPDGLYFICIGDNVSRVTKSAFP